MRGDNREWSVPEAFRALLWWPAVSFVIAVAEPDAAVPSIVVAGFVLALTGTLVPLVARKLRRGGAAGSAVEARDVRPVLDVVEPATADVETAA